MKIAINVYCCVAWLFLIDLLRIYGLWLVGGCEAWVTLWDNYGFEIEER